MERLYDVKCDYKLLNPLKLAFVGDCVYELLVREKLVCEENYPVGKLNKMKIEKVCCKAQAEAISKLSSFLTEEEKIIFKRGRNAHTHHAPKSASDEEYHKATGLEALIGYIYLKGDIKRVREFFNLMETF